jgi:hypothetical protein
MATNFSKEHTASTSAIRKYLYPLTTVLRGFPKRSLYASSHSEHLKSRKHHAGPTGHASPLLTEKRSWHNLYSSQRVFYDMNLRNIRSFRNLEY